MPRRPIARLVLAASLLLPGWPLAARQADPPPAAADPLSSSLAGEFALQDGQLGEAARQYLAAARTANDPVLAERATRIALLAGDDDLLREAYQAWIAMAPAGGDMQRTVAATLALRAGDKRASRKAVRALLADQDEGWKNVLAAMMAAVGKQPALVVSLVEDVVDDGGLPPQLDAWLGFGGFAQRLGQPKLVERIVAQVVARFPGEPRVVLLRAQLLREGGKLGEARAVLASLAEQDDLPPPLRLSIAAEYDALGDPSEAARLLAQGPQDDARYGQRAFLLDKAKDKAGLAALYEELKDGATHPSPGRRLLLGQVAENLDRNEEALSWYENVPGADAQSVARLRRAGVLHALGRKQAAYEVLRALQSDAMVDDEAQRDAYLLEAELRLKDGDAAGELDAYGRGLAAFADDKALLYSRALLWERRDDIAKAEADFRRILVIDAVDVDALNALGYTLADRTDRYQEALQLIDRARVAQPGSAAIIDSYGWVLFRLGRVREALDHLRQAYALQPDPDIASHLGQVLWTLGRKDEARHYFEEARRLDPDNRSLRRALQETGA